MSLMIITIIIIIITGFWNNRYRSLFETKTGTYFTVQQQIVRLDIPV